MIEAIKKTPKSEWFRIVLVTLSYSLLWAFLYVSLMQDSILSFYYYYREGFLFSLCGFLFIGVPTYFYLRGSVSAKKEYIKYGFGAGLIYGVLIWLYMSYGPSTINMVNDMYDDETSMTWGRIFSGILFFSALTSLFSASSASAFYSTVVEKKLGGTIFLGLISIPYVARIFI